MNYLSSSYYLKSRFALTINKLIFLDVYTYSALSIRNIHIIYNIRVCSDLTRLDSTKLLSF